MIDVKQNNWILDDTLDPPTYARSLGMAARTGMQPAVTFNEMQRSFWTKHFENMPYARRRDVCIALGIEPLRGDKDWTMHQLTKHFQQLVS